MSIGYDVKVFGKNEFFLDIFGRFWGLYKIGDFRDEGENWKYIKKLGIW